MSMEKLIAEVNELVEREYGRAGAKFGLTNHSDHESYAVLLEEFDEAKDEVSVIDQRMALFWQEVKLDAPDEHKSATCKGIELAALLAACELIQVAAMAKKAALTVCDRGAIVELKEGSAP